MQKSNQETSFHGKLIITVIEYWLSQVIFEQNDVFLKNQLKALLETCIPNIKVKIDWDSSSALIDRGIVSGNFYYIDITGDKMNMTFNVTATEANIKEYEKED